MKSFQTYKLGVIPKTQILWVFDFSSSPVGGGKRRLEELISFFNKTSSFAVFLTPPSLSFNTSDLPNILIIPLHKSFWQKIFFRKVDYKFFSSENEIMNPDIFFPTEFPKPIQQLN